jgi:aldehyde:ferredoxin oxidoreductase
MKVGERALALARAFNAREGYTAEDDVLPERFYHAFTKGPLKDKLVITEESLKGALQTYYAMSGWDPELATPIQEKLEDLDIAWVAEELKKAGVKL